jgi:hypothetical protein
MIEIRQVNEADDGEDLRSTERDVTIVRSWREWVLGRNLRKHDYFDFFDLASRKRIKSQPAVSCHLPEMEGVGGLGSLESRHNPPTKLKKGEFPKIEIFRHPSSTAMLNS